MKSKTINRNKSKGRNTKKRYGQIIEYSENKQQDKILMTYILNNPTSNVIVLLPTINLSSDLRTDLYDYLKDFGTIKAVKKIKLDFNGVVNLVNHFNLNQKKEIDIMKIKRQIMLDVSWQINQKKSIYVIFWQKKYSKSFTKIEKFIKDFLMNRELTKVVSTELSESMKQSSNTEEQTDEEVTYNFLANVIAEKLYMCMTHDYYETVLFSKLLLSKKLINKI